MTDRTQRRSRLIDRWAGLEIILVSTRLLLLYTSTVFLPLSSSLNPSALLSTPQLLSQPLSSYLALLGSYFSRSACISALQLLLSLLARISDRGLSSQSLSLHLSPPAVSQPPSPFLSQLALISGPQLIS
jgi:hypothetical protein